MKKRKQLYIKKDIRDISLHYRIISGLMVSRLVSLKVYKNLKVLPICQNDNLVGDIDMIFY